MYGYLPYGYSGMFNHPDLGPFNPMQYPDGSMGPYGLMGRGLVPNAPLARSMPQAQVPDPLADVGMQFQGGTNPAPMLRGPSPMGGNAAMGGGGSMFGFLQGQGLFDQKQDPNFVGPQLLQQQPSQQPQAHGLLSALKVAGLLSL